MFTCVIRYTVEPDHLDELRAYARSWIALINKYGGVHHGYFMPASGQRLPDATFSFPGRGVEAPTNIAYALFTFPSIEAYERYREDVKSDHECAAATKRFEEAPWFTRYERSFLIPLFE
jgi:hypothetical protein